MSWMTKNKWIVLGLMVVQFILCFFYIDSFPIALDEPFSIFHAQKSLPDLWEVFKNENNPPLHFILLHFWIKLFGTSAMAVRSLSLIFSVLTIPALFKLGKKITGTHGGILLVGFFIFSNFHHYHAIEARVYSLFVCLFAWIVLDLYQLIFEQRKSSIWRLLIWNTALLYSHYLAGFVIACEGLALVYFHKHLIKKDWINLFISGALSIILFIPGIQLWLMRYDAFTENTTWVPDPHWTELYGNIVRFMNGKLTYLLIGILLILLFFIRWNTLRNHWKNLITPKNQFVLLLFLLTYGGMFIVSMLFKPVFLDRYLLYTSILIFLLYLVVVEFLLHQKEEYLALLLLVPMIAFFDWQPENNREPDQMANWINSRGGEKSILISPPFYDLTFIYHYSPEVFEEPMSKDELMDTACIHTLYHGEELEKLTLKETVYFVNANAQFLYPENGIKQSLQERYELTDSAFFKGDYSVFQFIRK